MKVLITGAAGFIGSFLARTLLWRGDDVVGIDNFHDYYDRRCKEFNVDLVNMAGRHSVVFNSDEVVKPVYDTLAGHHGNQNEQRGSYTFITGDIVDFELLQKMFIEHKFDAVIHLGAMAGVPYSKKKPRLYSNVNVTGTVNLLELSKDHGVKKFLFASSSSVYGNREDRKVREEDDVLKAVSVYGATKVAGEVLCHSFYQMFGLSIGVIRIFGPIYGPLQRAYGMLHQRTINYVHNDKTLQIYGRYGLETAKDSTYIEDEIQGLVKALDTPFGFEIFNLGTSDPQPLRVWLDAVSKAHGKEIKMEIVDVDKADVTASADISKARNMLGYAPKFDQYEGVRRQVEVFNLMPEWYKTMERV